MADATSNGPTWPKPDAELIAWLERTELSGAMQMNAWTFCPDLALWRRNMLQVLRACGPDNGTSRVVLRKVRALRARLEPETDNRAALRSEQNVHVED